MGKASEGAAEVLGTYTQSRACQPIPLPPHTWPPPKSKDGLLLDELVFDDPPETDDHDREGGSFIASEDGSDMFDASLHKPRSSTTESHVPSITTEIMQCLRRPLFVSNALGYAAYV